MDPWKCTCGKKMSRLAGFCSNCGGKKPIIKKPRQKRCPKCGNGVALDNKYCGWCGFTLSQGVTPWIRLQRIGTKVTRVILPSFIRCPIINLQLNKEKLIVPLERYLEGNKYSHCSCGGGRGFRFCVLCGERFKKLDTPSCTICRTWIDDHLNEVERDHCPKCGRSKEEAIKPRAAIISAVIFLYDFYAQRSGRPLCRNCDEPLFDGENFCPLCGRSREEAEKAEHRPFLRRLKTFRKYWRHRQGK